MDTAKLKNSLLFQAGLFAMSVCFALQTCQGQSSTIVTSIGTIESQVGFTPMNWGYNFTIGSQPLTINALGFYDWSLQHDGNAPPDTAPEVGLWNASGTLLASTTVPIDGTIVGYFRYELLSSPVTLSADTTYYLGAFYPSGADIVPYQCSGATTDPDVTLGDAAYSLASTMSFPGATSSSYNEGFFGPNATYLEPVPEPTTLALAGLGGLGLLVFRRRSAK